MTATTFEAALPHAREALVGADPGVLPEAVWTREFAPDSDATWSTFITLVAQTQAQVALDADRLHAVSQAFLVDFVALRASGVNPGALDFMQLFLCTYPARVGIGAGYFSLAHDWIARSVATGDSATPTHELDVSRIERVYRSTTLPNAVRINVPALLAEWFATLYYYALHQRALVELAVAVADACPKALTGWMPRDECVDAFCHYLAWAQQTSPGHVQLVGRLLVGAMKDPRISPNALKQIAMTLATGAGESIRTIDAAEWSEWVLNTWGPALDVAQRVQVLATIVTKSVRSRRNDRLDELLGALDELSDHIAEIGVAGPAFPAYYAGRLFRMVGPAAYALLEQGRVDEARKFLIKMRRVPRGTERAGVDIALAANGRLGAMYAIEDTVLAGDGTGSQDSFRELMSAMNRVYGTAVNVIDDPAFTLEAPQREFGIPDPKAAQRFESSLEQHYRLPEISEAVRSEPWRSANGMIDVAGLQHPLQAMFVSHVGRSWPLVRSYQAPDIDRHAHSVFVWVASPKTYTADLEVGALRRIFGDRLNIATAEDGSFERFLQEYRSKVHDIIWVISHGDFRHHQPHTSALQMAEGHRLGVQELLALRVPEHGRRLLVVNSCDGGTAAPLNAPAELGIAASVAGRHQAVVSHICPVHPLAALVFGAVFAKHLVEGNGFFAAFDAALKVMRGGRAAIRAELAACTAYGELVPRLDNASLGFDNLIENGTAVFYE